MRNVIKFSVIAILFSASAVAGDWRNGSVYHHPGFSGNRFYSGVPNYARSEQRQFASSPDHMEGAYRRQAYYGHYRHGG